MKLIDISTPHYPNTFTQVDDSDFEWLNQWKWYPDKGAKTLYCKRNAPVKNQKVRQIRIKMHRIILAAPDGMMVDHKDGNGLNNQRENLRLCTASQNCCNRKRSPVSHRRFKGVHYLKSKGYYIVRISINKKKTNFGTFKNEEDAAAAYNEAAIKHHGEFAKLNVIPPEENTESPAGNAASDGTSPHP